jgi:hypothetical protein
MKAAVHRGEWNTFPSLDKLANLEALAHRQRPRRITVTIFHRDAVAAGYKIAAPAHGAAAK